MKTKSLKPKDKAGDCLNILIETPKGCRNKYKYDPGGDRFELKHVLPTGSVFPFDFGFLPKTLGEDGDPLDVLVLMDEPAFPGCLVPSRLIGVIEADQTEGKDTFRNDRLIAVADAAETYSEVRRLKDLNERLVDEIAHFFESYNAIMGDRKFVVRDYCGPDAAMKLVDEGIRRFGKKKAA